MSPVRTGGIVSFSKSIYKRVGKTAIHETEHTLLPLTALKSICYSNQSRWLILLPFLFGSSRGSVFWQEGYFDTKSYSWYTPPFAPSLLVSSFCSNSFSPLKSRASDLPWDWSSVPHKLADLLFCSVSYTYSLLSQMQLIIFFRLYLTVPFYTWKEH